jgi:hypothetical protein
MELAVIDNWQHVPSIGTNLNPILTLTCEDRSPTYTRRLVLATAMNAAAILAYFFSPENDRNNGEDHESADGYHIPRPAR